jgi:hypothetical protein
MENGGIGILWPFRIFYGHLVYFVAGSVHFLVIWYIFTVLVSCTKKDLAILVYSTKCDSENGSKSQSWQNYSEMDAINEKCIDRKFFLFQHPSEILEVLDSSHYLDWYSQNYSDSGMSNGGTCSGHT